MGWLKIWGSLTKEVTGVLLKENTEYSVLPHRLGILPLMLLAFDKISPSHSALYGICLFA
jgi:hypothetical protein